MLNQSFLVTSTPVNLNPDSVRYNLFMESLSRDNGSYNTLNDLSDKLCLLNKTQNLNVKIHKIKKEIYELKSSYFT